MDDFFLEFGKKLGQDPTEAFGFLASPVFWLALLAGVPLTIAAGVGLVYGGASMWNRLDARLFREPGEILLGREAGAFKDWLFHRPVTQKLPDALSGSEVNGPPRQGKTEFLASQGYQYLRHGVTVFVLELSGDLGQTLAPYARAMGKPVYFFDPSDFARSMKWSPLSGIPERVAEQAVTTFMSVSNTREEFFRIFNAVELRHIIHAVCSHARATGRIAWLDDCIWFLLDEDYQAEVLDLTRETHGKEARLKVGADYIGEHSRRWFDNKFLKTWTDRERNQFTEGLYGQLDNLLALEVVRYLLSPEPDDDYIDLGEALSSGGLIVFRLPQAQLGEAVARTLATWALQRFQQETLDRGAETNPVIALLDELHRTLGHKNPQASDSFASWTADIPKNRVGSIECYQSKAQLSPELRSTLATTARAKYFLGGSAPEDAREAEEVLGFEEVTVESRTKSRSGLSVFGAERQSDSVGRRDELKPRHRAEEIRETRRGYVWARLAVGGHLKAPVLVKTARLPEFSKVEKEFAAVPQGGAPEGGPGSQVAPEFTSRNELEGGEQRQHRQPDPEENTREIPVRERPASETAETAVPGELLGRSGIQNASRKEAPGEAAREDNHAPGRASTEAPVDWLADDGEETHAS